MDIGQTAMILLLEEDRRINGEIEIPFYFHFKILAIKYSKYSCKIYKLVIPFRQYISQYAPLRLPVNSKDTLENSSSGQARFTYFPFHKLMLKELQCEPSILLTR